MLSALLLLSLSTWPKGMTVSASGVSIQGEANRYGCWQDKKLGYYLYQVRECDGGHRAIYLTKDRRQVRAVGFDHAAPKDNAHSEHQSIHPRALQLQAGNGIRIGMTKSQVLRALGKPAKTAVRGKSREFWCAMYKNVRMTGKDDGWVLRNTYIFKHGKLIELSINLDSIPGCGSESLSDAHWPWTRF